AGARDRDPARHRLSRARHDAVMVAGADPDDAEGPLQDHDRLHAEGRPIRPRHDVPDLHGADQSRLRLRGRHGQEAARFRRSDGRADAVPGGRPTLSDWANHLSAIFPEVRLKRYLAMRGADGVPWGRLPALPAFWVGLLYDNDSLDAAWDLVKHWNAHERQAPRDDVPR